MEKTILIFLMSVCSTKQYLYCLPWHIGGQIYAASLKIAQSKKRALLIKDKMINGSNLIIQLSNL